MALVIFFLSLQQLSVVDFREDVLKFFQYDKMCNLLVIECNFEKEIQDLNEKLNEILMKVNKKIIFITNTNFALAHIFSENSGYDKPNNVSTSFKDLIAESQQKLLEQKITFQEKMMKFNEIIDVKNGNASDIIDQETLVNLIKNGKEDSKIEIAKNPLSICDLEAAYTKVFKIIDESALLEFLKKNCSAVKDIQNPEQQIIYFVVGGIQKPDLMERFEQQINDIEQFIGELDPGDTKIEKNITIVSFEFKEEDFYKICHNNATKKIYWLNWGKEQKKFMLWHFYNPGFYLKREFQYPDKTLNKDKIKIELSKPDLDIFIFSGIIDEKTFIDSFNFDLEAYQQFVNNLGTDKIKLLTETTIENKESIFKNAVQNDLNGTVHLVQVNERYQLIWQQSHGYLSNLSAQYTKIDSEDDLIKNVQGKSIIIIDMPGMGKSTSLSSLSQKMQNSYWVIHLELKDCFKAIQNLPQKTNDINIDHLVKFLADTKAINTPLERNLIQFKLKHGSDIKPLLLMFDGFDEIKCSDIRDIEKEKGRVGALLKFIKSNTKAIVWVTARQHDTVTLQESLSIFDIKFDPLNSKQQEKYFKDAWENTLKLKLCPERLQKIFAPTSDSKFTKYYSVLKKHIDLSLEEEKFMGIPLTLRLFEEIFREKFEIFVNTEREMNIEEDFCNLSFLTLYEDFIDAKFKIFFREKTNLSTESNHIAVTYKLIIIKEHQRLAFNELFGDNLTEELLGIKSPFLPSLKIDSVELGELARCGLIKYVQSNNVEFIHRSIAEYFVAKLFVYLMTIKKKRNLVIYNKAHEFLEKNIMRQSNTVVYKFLDAISKQDEFFLDEWEKIIHKEKENLLGEASIVHTFEIKFERVELKESTILDTLKQNFENNITWHDNQIGYSVKNRDTKYINQLYSKFITLKGIAGLADILEFWLKMAYHKTSNNETSRAIESILPTAIIYYVTQAKEQNEENFQFITNWLEKIAGDDQRIDTDFSKILTHILNDKNKSEILTKYIEDLQPNINDEELIQKINAKYSNPKHGFYWLERNGITIINSSMILTFQMSEKICEFIKGININTYNGCHRIYSEEIHDKLMTYILNMLKFETLYPKRFTKIDKSALLNIFQAFSKFHSLTKLKRCLTDLQFESLFSCIEHVLHPKNISVHNILYAFESLRELKSWGFTLDESLTLMHKRNEVYKYKLKVHYKSKFVKLLQFQNLNTEFEFCKECSVFVENCKNWYSK